MKGKYIGIDLGGTNIKGLILQDGKITKKVVRKTREQGNWQQEVMHVHRELMAHHDGQTLRVGLSAPGITGADNRTIAFLPNRLKGLEDLDWSEFLGVDANVLNDAHAALLAEAKMGVGRDHRNLVMITLGTGVGGGLLIDGKIHQGFLHRAGHLGHMSVDATGERPSITGITGSLEDAIGENSIEARSLGRFQSTHELVNAFSDGDHWATFIWLSSVRKLALAISSMCNTLSPTAVILAGGISNAGEALLGPLRSFLDLYEWRPGGVKTPILQAHFREYAGALGAALFCAEQSEQLA